MYGPDLAAHHHDHSTTLARGAAATLIGALAAARVQSGRIADVGCGSGVGAAAFAAAGYDVLAVDPSASMLRLVAKHAPTATRQKASLATMDLPRGLAAISAVGEVVGYDVDGDLDDTLDVFGDALRPGGLLLLDAAGPGRHGGGTTHQVTTGPSTVMGMQAIERGYRLERRITLLTREDDGRYRRRDETHELRLHPEVDVLASLSRAGFVAIRRLSSYGADAPAFGAGWHGFLASRS